MLFKVRFFNPGLWYEKHRDEILGEIDRVLKAGDLILRNDVEKFEKNLAEFVGTKYAVGLNSGTDALYLALKAVGVKQGDRIVVPSHTFVATAQVVQQLGAEIVLYDIDGILPSNHNSEVLILTHIAGEKSNNVCGIFPNGFILIEDACQALGAKGIGEGIIQCWSFYPAKILGAYGDAGAITTNDENIYNEIKELRNHYKKDYSKWGINSRMDNLQAAILNVKFKYLPETLARRKEIAEIYLQELKGVVGLPNNQEGRVWQDFIIRTEKRDELYEYLKIHGIETIKNEYPMPIGKLPLTAKYEAETLRIPCNENLNLIEVEYVISKIKQFYGC